jgi:CubicO group peptidase (beta-lactamase class C family)
MKISLFCSVIFCFITLCPWVGMSANIDHDEKDKITAQVDSLLKGYAFYGRFSGTVLVAQNDEVIYTKSFGIADYDVHIPNHNASVYGIGSITKTFTATAIMKLAQDGKLKLDDELYDYFPGLGEVARNISIHHLLSMSSGIFEDFSRSKSYDISKVILPESYPVPITHLVHHFGDITSDATPGKKYDYSNYNYILLAAIIEQVSGMEFGQFLENEFFIPLGMIHTAFGYEQADSELLSKPYLGLPLTHEQPPYWHDSWVKGAGGIFASATDIYKWLYAIHNNEILNEEYSDKMLSPQMKTSRESYGYGWQMGTRKNHPWYGHEGGTLGYVSEAGFFPEQGLYVVVLTNHTHGINDIGKSVLLNHEINAQLQNILFDLPYTVLPVPIPATNLSFAPQFSINGYHFHNEMNGNNMAINSQGSVKSLLDVAYEQNLVADHRHFRKVARIARAFGDENFRYVWRKSDIMLKVLVSPGKLQNTWNELTGEKGSFRSYNFYQLPASGRMGNYRVRLVHEHKEIGLRLVLNKRGRLSGLHIDQRFSYNGPKEIEAFIINENLIFIDGFRYGYSDARLVKQGERWQLVMLGQTLLIED